MGETAVISGSIIITFDFRYKVICAACEACEGSGKHEGMGVRTRRKPCAPMVPNIDM